MFAAIPTLLCAQQNAVGKVVDASGNPLYGANVYWANTQIGSITTADGSFSLEPVDGNKLLVASFVGFTSDTLKFKGSELQFTLKASTALKEVEIVKRQKATRINRMATLKTEQIGEKELLKAACCNLSESFETSPSVDVSFSDAVTGTRQIQMLGLAGPYSQLTRENIPAVRGLSAVSGLTYIPGTWIESIQLNKGAGSVVNGYESIVGQINYELRKPLESDALYLNAYANQGGRYEFNLHATTSVSDKIATAGLFHYKTNQVQQDRNADNFLDMPLSEHFIGLNRWFFLGKNGWRYQFGVKAISVNSEGGQLSDVENLGNARWYYSNTLQRGDAWVKAGKTFDLPWKSVGLQASGSMHKERSLFGLRNYDGDETTFYFNSIYQSIIVNTNNTFRTGLSFQYDKVNESLTNFGDFEREEIVPGAYFEFNKTFSEKFKLVAGLRGDYHNLYGAFVTPRAHLWYAVGKKGTLRASAGRGQRTASIISENLGLLASNRQFEVVNPQSNLPYGLQAETAWNYGMNYTYKTYWFTRDLVVAFDIYRTNFENQIVVDRDADFEKVLFYNLDGQSFANSAQMQVDYEVFTRFDARIAYRWFDVKNNLRRRFKNQTFTGTKSSIFKCVLRNQNTMVCRCNDELARNKANTYYFKRRCFGRSHF